MHRRCGQHPLISSASLPASQDCITSSCRQSGARRVKSWNAWRAPIQRLRRYLRQDGWLPVLRRLPSGSRHTALSFDDGPNEGSTLPLLDVLDRHRARASFFLSGFRVVQQPELVGQLVKHGHDVYAHGWDHVRHDRLTPEEIAQSMERTEALLRAWRPTPSPYLVRLPHGAGHKQLKVHQAIRAWNPRSQIADWGASCRDWEIGDRCVSLADVERECQTARRTLFATETVVGAILLLHDQPIGKTTRYAAEITLRLAELVLSDLGRLGVEAVAIPPMV